MSTFYRRALIKDRKMEDRNFNPQDYHVEEDSDGPDYKDVLRFVYW